MYKWTDEKGTLHFTDSLSNVPAKYRPKIESKEYGDVQRLGGSSESGNVSVSGDPSFASQGNASSSRQKEIRVPYRAYEGSASRIIISVTFNGAVTVPMLLDTGAPGMVITPELAGRIGLFDRDDGMLLSQAGGIGGRVPAILTIVDSVSAGGATTRFLPTTITKMFSGAYEGLVGMDFMANYDLQVDSRNQVVIFRELPPDPNRPAGRGEYWWRSKFNDFSALKGGWENYLKRLEGVSPSTTTLERLKKIALYQAAESVKLYDRLDRYASQSGVPRHWRK